MLSILQSTHLCVYVRKHACHACMRAHVCRYLRSNNSPVNLLPQDCRGNTSLLQQAAYPREFRQVPPECGQQVKRGVRWGSAIWAGGCDKRVCTAVPTPASFFSVLPCLVVSAVADQVRTRLVFSCQKTRIDTIYSGCGM